MVIGREGSDSIFDQSHLSHASLASFPTTDPVATSSCHLPVPSPTPTPSRSAISPPLSSAADPLAAHSSSRARAQVSFPAIPKKPSFHTRDFVTAIPCIPPPPLTSMGQGSSKSSPPLPSPPTSSTTAVTKGIQAALAGGIKLKRVLVNRRKKSEDVYLSDFKNKGTQQGARQLAQNPQGHHIRADSYVPLLPSVSLRSQKPTLNPSNLTVVMAPDLPELSPTPPTPPPKSPPMQPLVPINTPPSSLALEQPPTPRQPSAGVSSDNRDSIMPLSPGMTGAVKLIYMNEEQTEKKESDVSGSKSKLNVENGHEQSRERVREADTLKREGDAKETRRKSDSTISYQTIRPGTTSNRTSRPVSMAESLQSNHTVKPVRISALITDVDFTTLEEDDDACQAADQDMTARSTSPAIVHSPQKMPQEVSCKTKNRRSLSLNLGTYPPWQALPPASHHATLSLSEIKYPSYSVTEGMPPPMQSSVPSATSEVIETSTTSQTGHNTSSRLQVGHNLRGKLSSWTNPSMGERKSPAFQPRIPPPSAGPALSSYPPQALRAISMTSSLAPAAGRAIRGAVGRMGRVIGISSSSSNSGYNSGYSSSTSSPSDGHGLTRTNSNQSSSVGHTHSPLSWGRRRTPDAPSGAWSIVSSTSDIDYMGMPSVPSLGVMLRAPSKSSGHVFGRDLKVAVRSSVVSVRQPSGEESQIQRSLLSDLGKTFEERALPAVVVRCAQHILVRGVQEEGLFRVNGRAKHVATIRAEFDRGADYDMAACEPVDLDPHAVASVFKAFFRELPEPVLTAALLPFFERIVEQEMNAEPEPKASHILKPSSRGPGLPSGPRPGNSGPQAMRKPPSLSTLALPSFKEMLPPSNSLLRAIKALTAQLPEENRDLLRILIDIMNATAENEVSTKMPLANLVLVFCPTVQMTPPLLRILCEARGLWDQDDISLAEETSVVERASSSSSEAYVDATDDMEGESLLSSGEVSEETPGSMSDYQASAEDSIDPRVVIPRCRPVRLARKPQSTVYLDAECGSSSASSLSQTRCTTGVFRDNISLASSQFQNAFSRSSTPPMSSSAESLVTPASSSGQSSLPHLPIDYNMKSGAEQVITENLESPKYINDETASYTSPVQFPSLPLASLPSTPVKRRSVPLLSLPHLPGMNASPSAILVPSPTPSVSNSSLHWKSKKPSLQILLSAKGSNSSLKGISKSSISNPIMNVDCGTASLLANGSSVPMPHSEVTAPEGSVLTLSPMIGMPLETPLGVGTGFVTPSDTTTLEVDPRYRDDEDVVTIESAKLGTPIADRYRTTSTTSTSSSVFSVAVAARSLPDVPITSYFRRSPRRLATSTSSTSSNHLDFLDKDLGIEEDWTRSVLIAADIEPILSQKMKS